MPIGNAAARSGCAIETIRFYEKMGILPKAHRTMSERRVYNDADIARISFIRRARELGFSLDQVRSLLTLAEGHSGACEKVHPIAAHHLDEIVTKITALNAMRQVLADLVAQCARGNVSACPLIGVLSGTP
ncbi:MAG: helix-turn-helix domain-containing protein [Hyphomicrobiales bacterium]|nr:helix-turn-helix domain-containing protein [Hyphomicrobiales bacterium]MDE2115942.1 helix-turn-helix domain-containing protein [Hyphomicrobiales bacterium]